MEKLKYGTRNELNTIFESSEKIIWIGYLPENSQPVFIKNIPLFLINYPFDPIKIKSFHNISESFIKIYDILFDNEFCYIITEYIEKPYTLLDFMRDNPKTNEEKSIQIFKELIEKINILYEKGVLYYNLSPNNIFIEFTPYNEIRLKLTDYGISYSKSRIFTPEFDLYMGPEYKKKKESYNLKTEIHILGYLLYLLIEGKLPSCYQNTDLPCFNASPLTWHFLNGCLQFNPEMRFSWAELFSHPAILGIDNCILLNKFVKKSDYIQKQRRIFSWIMTIGEWKIKTKNLRSHMFSQAFL